MKKLTCELCGSNDFVKEEGLFVCQSCGTKYSPDEARKMMIEGTVEVKGTIQVDRSSVLENYLSLAEDAMYRDDIKKTLDYTQRVLDIDSGYIKAWEIRFKAYEKTSDYDSLVATGKSMIRFAPQNDKKSIEERVYTAYADKAEKITKITIEKLTLDQESKDRINNVNQRLNNASGHETISIWVDALLKIIRINLDSAGEALQNEQYAFVLMNEIPAEILGQFINLREKVNRWITGRDDVIKAFDAKTSFYQSYTSTPGGLTVFQEKSIKSQWDGQRDSIVSRLREADEIVEKARLEKVSAYWKEHVDEKESLDNEKASLEARAKVIRMEIEKMAEYNTVKDLIASIADAQGELKSLSIFKIRDKKLLQQKIESLNHQLDTAKKALQIAIEPYDQENSKIKARICEIDKRLNLLQ